MASRFFQTCVLACVASHTLALTYNIPSTPPCDSSAQLVAAPVGVSIEFFAFPGYFNVPSTSQCLQNLQSLTGTWPPMRVGGTTQDRATYNASSPNEVTYSVSSPSDAPASLTFGPSFFSLAAKYGGKVIMGLNRRLNNQPNTISAAKQAHSTMSNLDAIELGNEPNFYSASDPIAGGSWGASKDFSSQASWEQAVGSSLSTKNIFSAGVYFGTGSFSNQGLVGAENQSSLQYVKDFCSHNYPQSGSTANLSALMSHTGIASQISQYAAEYSAVESAGKTYIMGETNSATQGGGGISPTFGAGLWILDYVMQLLILGVERIYFHQGTIGNCQYCWWGRYDMGAPYYGAYFATMALAGADHIARLDDGTSAYAVYGIYKGGAPAKVLLYNSDYYASGSRTSQSYTLTGLDAANSVTARRLTAPYATSRQDQGQNPTVAGQTFANGTCAIQGTPAVETATVSGGAATFTVAASEALLVYL